MNIPDSVRQWMKHGERGLSSECIVETLTGIPIAQDRDEKFHPRDPSDLIRCRKLLTMCPELVPLFPKMAEVSPAWSALVENWQTLCDLLDAEAPEWGKGRGVARKCYELMHKLTENCV